MKLQFLKFAFAVLVAALSPALVFALDFTVDGMYFKVINDDEVAIANYYGTVEYVGDIVIPETVVYDGVTYCVTAIADNTFYYQDRLTSVNTGHSVKSIGKYAFDQCDMLTSIYLGSAVEQIHEMAIMNCNQLLSIRVHPDNPTFDSREDCNAIIESASNTLVRACMGSTIPASVTAIGTCGYAGLNMKEMEIPASVVEIGDNAFRWCDSLERVTILGPVEIIGEAAFSYNPRLASINLPSTVKSIGREAFQYSALTSIHFPDQLTIIEERVLDGCDKLTEVTLGNHVTAIRDFAVQSCRSLTHITLPSSLKSIGWDAFAGDSKLTGVIFPDSLEFLGESAFYGCDLRSVVIPKSVTSIGTDAVAYNRTLSSIVVEEGNQVYDSRDNCNAIIETATNMLIEACMYTVIPNTVTTIGYNGFAHCIGLTSVTIPESVKTIENYGFRNCSYLYTVIIPKSVTSIGMGAFSGCRRLNSTTCKSKTPPTTGSNPFTADALKGTLYVPRSAVELYKAHEEWGKFPTILPMPDGGAGDTDGDGEIRISDVVYLIDMLLRGDTDINESPYADVNGDGRVSIGDVTAIINHLLSTP